MNDPGLEQPTQEAAQDVEKDEYEKKEQHAKDEEREYLDPRYASRRDFQATYIADLCYVAGGGSRRQRIH